MLKPELIIFISHYIAFKAGNIFLIPDINIYIVTDFI